MPPVELFIIELAGLARTFKQDGPSGIKMLAFSLDKRLV